MKITKEKLAQWATWVSRTWYALIGLSVLVTLLGVYLTFGMVNVTSDDKFCSSCHTMQPMVDSYLEDPHGGATTLGVKAKCTECHLPHTGPIRYMIAKGITGIHDVFAQTFYNLEKIDWNKKRIRRGEFTYDSGCLQCHSNFPESMNKDHGAVVAHKAYLAESESKRSCVSCHMHVGHHNLTKYLKRKKK